MSWHLPGLNEKDVEKIYCSEILQRDQQVEILVSSVREAKGFRGTGSLDPEKVIWHQCALLSKKQIMAIYSTTNIARLEKANYFHYLQFFHLLRLKIIEKAGYYCPYADLLQYPVPYLGHQDQRVWLQLGAKYYRNSIAAQQNIISRGMYLARIAHDCRFTNNFATQKHKLFFAQMEEHDLERDKKLLAALQDFDYQAYRKAVSLQGGDLAPQGSGQEEEKSELSEQPVLQQQRNKPRRSDRRSSSKGSKRQQKVRHFKVYAARNVERMLRRAATRKSRNSQEQKQDSTAPTVENTVAPKIDQYVLQEYRDFVGEKIRGLCLKAEHCLSRSNETTTALQTPLRRLEAHAGGLKDVSAGTIAEFDRLYESLRQEITTAIHRLEKSRTNARDARLRQKEISAFLGKIIAKIRKESLQEARNAGGAIMAPAGIADIWRRCAERFHNRSFPYDGEVEFLDERRPLSNSECFAYYVTESSHTPNALFCISVHLWKMRAVWACGNYAEQLPAMEEEEPEESKESGNTEPVFGSDGTESPEDWIESSDISETDPLTAGVVSEHAECQPAELMDPQYWIDTDRPLGNAFLVLHILDPESKDKS